MKPSLALRSVLALGLFFAGATAAQAQLKMGTVDMNKVFAGYYKTKDAENKINEAREGAKRELDERLESHKQLLDEITTMNKEIDNPALSAAAKADRQKKREDKIKQVQALENEIKEFQATRERGLQEQAVRMRNTIVEEIMAIIQNKVKAESFDLVLDKSGMSMSNVPVVLHANDKWEFSEEVITQLNKNRPPPTNAATPAPAASPKK